MIGVTRLQWWRVDGAVCNMLPGASKEGRKMGAVIFLRHEIYKNSVSSIEAGMGTEGLIMCIEQCTF